MEQVFATADKLSEVIRDMQKCLQCTICLHTITAPVKTRCGHRFCRECIQTLLQDTNATCPLCKSALHRRSISKDEHMEMYIDRLEKLIQAIQIDSGIDILYQVSRPRSTCESNSSGPMENSKQKLGLPGPSGSNIKKNAKRRSGSNSKSQKSKNTARKSRDRKDSDITKYLNKNAFSGIEPLPPDELPTCQDDSTKRVQSWLETLPDDQALDDPNTATVPVENNLDDTLLCSISQNREEKIDKLDKGETKLQEQRLLSREATARQRSSETRSHDSKSSERCSKPQQVVTACDDQQPSTSGLYRSREDNKEKMEQASNDTHRTPPSDILSTTKKNWSNVVQFGKEMRRKRKKLKSLNVSIENTNKSRSNDESAKEEASTVINTSVKRRRSRGNLSESVTNVDKQLERLPNVKSVQRVTEDSPPAKEMDVSMSDQPAKESSFITLEEGEPVHIRSLNSHQMNNIIGIDCSENQEALRIEGVEGSDAPRRSALSPKQSGLAGSPLQATPTKSVMEASPPKTSETVPVPLDKSTPLIDTERMDGFALRFQSPVTSQTPSRNRLSLRKRSTDSKSNEPPGLDTAPRLLTVRRDLNRQMDQNGEEGSVERLAETRDKPKENGKEDITVSPDKIKDKQGKGQEGHLVAFRKLGKVFKHRRKLVTFLYLGSTLRRPTYNRSYLIKKVTKPCNPMDVEELRALKSSSSEKSSNSGAKVALNEPVEDDLSVPQGQPESIKPGPSIRPAASTKRIDLYKESTPMQPITIASKSDGSDDLVLVSLHDNEKALPMESAKSHSKSSASRNTASKDTVRMLSPKKDSQLKFLTLDSPTTSSAGVDQKGPGREDSSKNNNFSDIRGAHSRALIRKSQQASEASESRSSSPPEKKRKRSSSREKLDQRLKRKSRQEEGGMGNESDSGSASSKVTYVINQGTSATEAVPAKTDDSSSKDGNTVEAEPCKETVIVSSDTDPDSVDTIQMQKKTYRRVIPLLSSDTDSPDYVWLNCDKKNEAADPPASPTSKRKRTVSSDSDETDVNVIVKSWYEDTNDRGLKKGKVEPHGLEKKNDLLQAPKASFSGSNKVSALQRRHLSDLGVASNSEKQNSQNKREILSRDVFDDDSPDFGATIDRIRDIQKTSERDSNKRIVNYCLIQDNFDDVIANVDTEALEDYTQKKAKKSCEERVPCLQSSSKNIMAQSNSSDKENRYKTLEETYEFKSDDEDTLTEHVENGRKDVSQSDKLRSRPLKSIKGTVLKPAVSDKDKLDAGKDTLKDDTCYDQDSLLNITQHYLMIKQFEEDLFGKPSSSNAVERTPQKLKSAKGGSNLREEDAEHSGEEDDIVENTPDAKTRSAQSNSLASKKSSPAISLASNIKQQATTPSSVAVSSTASPTRKRDLHPLHQSTPKARALAKSNYGATCPFEKSPDLATSANESSDKQTKGVAGRSAQRLCFVCSGLLPSQIQSVRRLAQLVNAEYLAQFDDRVTHVIVKVNEENNSANKTLKYLQGVAHRKWIVGYQWVIDSLKENGLVAEEPYEAVDCRTLEAGPRNSRLRQRGLFEGFVFFCLGPYVDVSVDQFQELLRATGAIVVHSLEALMVERQRFKIIVIQAEVYKDEIIIGWYRKARAVPIIYEWVLECISQYKLISFYRYLQELSQQDVRELGFPEFLFEEDLDEDSSSMCDVST
ncbi:uncharacterized protein LOC143181422 [Calliopsis andreniformis]|uniref:uncharacterized protein LOC143181422 n=1 Tax=Calliopsis andreniformis TaxID=337506 RepID=UPI003FCC41AF